MEQSEYRTHRAAGLLSGALLVFTAFAIYSWIASNGAIDSPTILLILVLVMALPTAFVVFAVVRVVKVSRRFRVPPSRIRYFEILKPSAIVLLCVSAVVGVATMFGFDSLGSVGAFDRVFLFVVGVIGSAVIGVVLAAATALAAFLFARGIAGRLGAEAN